MGNSKKQAACIVYHKDDNDGVFSGAFMCLYYMKALSVDQYDIKLIGVDYNDLKTWDTSYIDELYSQYEHITLTDISLPVELMEYMFKLWDHKFLWFDHHAPIIKAVKEAGLDDKIKGSREDNGVSALYLTFKHLYYYMYDEQRHFKIPKIFEALSKWDSFTFDNDEDKLKCQELNMGITCMYNLVINDVISQFKWLTNMPYMMEYECNTKCEMVYKEAANIGQILLTREFQKYDELVERNGDFSWILQEVDGTCMPACALFIQGATNSTMFRKAEDKGAIIGLVFKHNPDSSWAVSAYHTNTKYDIEHHIGNWCRAKYNGGGHAGAGGFTITEEQFINILKTKII